MGALALTCFRGAPTNLTNPKAAVFTLRALSAVHPSRLPEGA